MQQSALHTSHFLQWDIKRSVVKGLDVTKLFLVLNQGHSQGKVTSVSVSMQ